MPYATRADLETRFGESEVQQLADPYSTGMVDDAILAPALADADAEIDAYLIGRYTLPLATIPANLVRIACDITRYRLWKDQASEEVRSRYTDAAAYLQRVANGSIPLGPSVTGTATESASSGMGYSAPVRAMSDAFMAAL